MKKDRLQRFTKFELKKKNLWDLKQITHEALDVLTNDERVKFLKEVNEKLAIVKGGERDALIKQFELIFSNETKNRLWEYNHTQLTIAIATLMQEFGRMPSKIELAEKAGLSRPTIDKHLKEYTINPLYIQEIEQFKFMTAKVLARVFTFAVNGDIRACKLYLECMGNMGLSSSTNINTQNNFIQINGLTIRQEQIQQLNKHQLEQIQDIVTLKDNDKIIRVIVPNKK